MAEQVFLNKTEVIEAMKKGQRATHTSFTDDEWITITEDGNMLLEDNVRCIQEEFWKYRPTGFETGWLIVPTVKNINVSELKQGSYMFGGRGDVWSKTAHIAFPDGTHRTLCDTPMLSTNWCRIEGVEEIGCKECTRIYKEKTKTE